MATLTFDHLQPKFKKLVHVTQWTLPCNLVKILAAVYEQLYYISQFSDIIGHGELDLWPFTAKMYSARLHGTVDTSIKFGESPCSSLWAIVLHITIFRLNRPWRPWPLTFYCQNLMSSSTWHSRHFHKIWWKSQQRFMSNCTTCHNCPT